ncbi:MAG: DNA-processing protein DprA, partial [Candidatus Moranbacteria bacterium]|nr:DNA-processing protein DprA [Candidatus Moranbacteria bacterium]
MLIEEKQPDKWLIGLFLCAEPQIGAVTIKQLLSWLKEKEFTLGQFWRQKEKMGQAVGLTEAKIAALKKIGERFGDDDEAPARLKEYLERRKISLCINNEADFPPLLKLITDCPAGIFYQGDLACLQKLCLSVVGTRQMTGYGRRVIKELLAPPLDEITIVSGMMTGVDEAAHRQALAIGSKTAAILGYGLELTWPRYLASLRTEIINQGGVVMSEYAPWSEPQPFRFPVRNRLVAGLSLATLIIEVATKSGSLITANLAIEDGTELLLVPGSIFSPLSNGTLGLLQVGATPVTKTAE